MGLFEGDLVGGGGLVRVGGGLCEGGWKDVGGGLCEDVVGGWLEGLLSGY